MQESRTSYPPLLHSQPSLKEKATLIDVMSMRSGMERYKIWSQSENRINFKKPESMKVINSLRSATELRETFAYNTCNWGYEVTEHVIKEAADDTWDSLLQRNIFKSLDLERTDASGVRVSFNNITELYMILNNGDPVSAQMTLSQV